MGTGKRDARRINLKCGTGAENMVLRHLRADRARYACKGKRLTSMTPEERRIALTCRRLTAKARQIWQWDPQRRAVLDESEAAAQPERAKSKRDRRLCVLCKRSYDKREVHADHVAPVGRAPKSFKGWDEYYARMFTTRENIQPLCEKCHAAKTQLDMKQIRGTDDR